MGELIIGGCMTATPISDDTEMEKIIPQNNQTSVPLVDESPTSTTPSREERLDMPTPKVTPADLSQLLDNLVTGEVPQELLDEILTNLATQFNITTQEIRVIRAEAVVWPDGSLGCPKIGQFYTQALVEGYWVILQVDDKFYDYRVSDSGYLFLCEGRGRIPISPPDKTPPKE